VSISKLVIFTDGASRGNPGPASIGVAIKDERGLLIDSISKAIGRTTNNQAEYRAIIAALERALSLEATHVDLRSDSELVVKQINGLYRVKKASLKPLYLKAAQLASQFKSFTITSIPREKNVEADKLANMALD